MSSDPTALAKLREYVDAQRHPFVVRGPDGSCRPGVIGVLNCELADHIPDSKTEDSTSAAGISDDRLKMKKGK